MFQRRFTFSNVSDGVVETIIKVQRKPPKERIFQEDQLETSRYGIASQLSVDNVNEKQMKSLCEGSFLEKEHLHRTLF